MTFQEIVSRVMDRLNLTSSDAEVRVGQRVNEVYKDVTTSIGLVTSRRTILDVDVDPLVEGAELPELTVGMEKIIKISRTADTGGVTVLKEVFYDDVTNWPTNTGLPTMWATKRYLQSQITIVLNSYPPDETFTLKIEGYDITDELDGDNEPYLPPSFHDLLEEGAIALELRKMEKAPLAQIAEDKFTRRLSDLRMFIAKSAYLDIVQGRNKPSSLWYRQWVSRLSMFN